MSRGEAYRRIKLLEAATGKRVDAPFLELDEELWSPDGTRFTLLFDPGRIKRGLRPREEVGPVLEAGKSYSLVIDRHWLDASGNLLKAGFRKTFRVGPPDETSPDPKTWTIDAPRAGSRDPLEVRFPEPLDRALLDRLIWVENADAKVVAGQISLGDGRDNAGDSRRRARGEKEPIAWWSEPSWKTWRETAWRSRLKWMRPARSPVVSRPGRSSYRFGSAPSLADNSRVARSARVAQPVVEIRWA